MEESEYKNGEKVLFKAKCRLSRQDKEPNEADCFITENYVILEAEEPIKIPVLRVKDHRIAPYSTVPPTPDSRSLIFAFLDEQKKRRNLSLEMTLADAASFKSLLMSEIEKAKIRWRESQPVEKRWFARHLNWTLVPIWILALALEKVFGLTGLLGFTIGSFAVFWSPIVETEATFTNIIFLVTLAIVLAVTGWVLRKKNRSLFNLLWYLVPPPISLIIMLCLTKEPKLT